MKKLSKHIFILFGCICVVSALLTAAAILVVPEFAPVCAVASAMMIVLAALTIKKEQSYTEAVIANLSDLIASISSLDGSPIIPEYEDSLLSKLQSQAIKLTEMLTSSKNHIEAERDEIKSLISDISHQLKTPVATLNTYGELLLESDSEENKVQYLAEFSVALEKLSFLTDSMIKLSRLESGVIVTVPRLASFNLTVLGAVKQVYGKASKKGVEIVFDCDRESIEIMHDEKWSCEAIFNMLDNAVKYTPTGGMITIEMQKYEMFARLDISDNGIGIAPDEQTKIFGRFFRGSNASNEEGAGIGLYLARKIITDQGGYIKVRSTKSGSTFSVFLPMNR